MNEKIPATVTVLTFNSEKGIERCLASVTSFAEILVLDGGSTDRTIEIARKYGARIETQSETPGPISNFTEVRERSFQLASQDWIFWLDSDEWMDETLAEGVRAAVGRADEQAAYRAERFPIVEGRIIRHAYFSPERVLRFVNRKTAHWVPGKRVHEHLAVSPGVRIEELPGGVYTPWATLEAYRKKDRYYLALAFSIPLTRRPPFVVTIRSVIKNLGYAVAIFCLGVYFPIRYRTTRDALPFRYHRRFAAYHLNVVWQRLRQFFLGQHYGPPAA